MAASEAASLWNASMAAFDVGSLAVLPAAALNGRPLAALSAVAGVVAYQVAWWQFALVRSLYHVVPPFEMCY